MLFVKYSSTNFPKFLEQPQTSLWPFRERCFEDCLQVEIAGSIFLAMITGMGY